MENCSFNKNVKRNNLSYNQCMLNHISLYINIICEAKSIQSDILNGWLLQCTPCKISDNDHNSEKHFHICFLKTI